MFDSEQSGQTFAYRHRRIEFEELRRYQTAQQQQLEQSLQDLTQLSEELALAL